jgi:GTP-binding protein
VAFAGRSNAGKSSALNAITGVGGLARVSKTPGRTRLLNVFETGPGMRLVDLPGYGYAKVPEAERLKWGEMVESYLGDRESLAGLMLVMDIRHPLTDFDRQMLGFAAELQIPAHVLLSKADKLSRGAAASTRQQVQRDLRGWGTTQLFSAHSGQGVEDAQKQLAAWLMPE